MAARLSNNVRPDGARQATNGYWYVPDGQGGWTRVAGDANRTPAEQYDAANEGAYRDNSGDNMGAYLDTILEASGMTGGNVDVQGSASGNTGTGSGSGKGASGSDSGKEPTADDEQKLTDALDKGIGLEELAAGAAGAGVAILADRMLRRRKVSKPNGSDGPASPATDTAGPADKGGPGGSSNARDIALRERGGQIIDATFDEILGIAPPPRAITGPDNVGGGTPATDGTTTGASAAIPAPDDVIPLPPPQSAVDDVINSIDDPSQPMADPVLEEALQKRAASLRQRGFDNPFALDDGGPPDMRFYDDAMKRRIRAILAAGL